MKKIINLLVAVILCFTISAQSEKQDVILKTNGEELKGKVTEVSDSEIKFIYLGETAVYVIKKSDIQKITYASGRVENISAPSSSPQNTPANTTTDKKSIPVVNEADTRNKVAVLPFAFLKQNEDAGDAVTYKVQEDAFDYLSKHAGVYSYIDPRTTNALLMKAGINKSNIMGYTMNEVCSILGVEYLVMGTITQTKAATTTSGSNNTTVKTDTKDSNKGTVSGSSSSSSYDYYGVTVAVQIFNNKNTQVFSDSHKRAFNSTTADYLDPLHYVLKRSPLYQK